MLAWERGRGAVYGTEMQLFGLLNLNKPPGVTSRRLVDRVQRLVKPAKVGHAGTLDPLASGVLVLGIGPATRLVEYIQEMPKHYRATFLLGRTSTTEDIDGEVTELEDAVPPTRERLERIAEEMTGEIEQRPPIYSALKVSGRRAYALARAGQQVELAPRMVRIHCLRIVRYEYPELCLDVACGGGTYVRSLGRDLAERAGTAAVMSALERTAIGRFVVADALEASRLTPTTLPNTC
jgi:tRNA pseudouridine55 synthase